MIMKFLVYSLCAVLALTPSFAFATNYYNNQQNVIIRQKVVEFDARTYLGTDGYYTVGEQLKNKKSADLQSEVDQLKAQLDLLIKLLGGNGQGKPVQPAPEQPTTPLPAPQQPSEPSAGEPTKLDLEVFDIFTKSCVKCHGEKGDGDLVLLKKDGQGAYTVMPDLDTDTRVIVHHRVNGVNLNGEAHMPKGGQLTDKEVEALRLWSVQKAKENRRK